jgi:biotin carboxyl carrier protein
MARPLADAVASVPSSGMRWRLLVAANAVVLSAGLLSAAAVAPPAPGVAAAPAAADVQAVPDRQVAEPPEPEVRADVVVPPAAEPAPVEPANAPAEPPAPPPPPRSVVTTGYGPYATAGPVTLHYPGDVVEAVGLHQSGHDGAQPQEPVGGPARIGLLENRSRDTHPQGAADIVVDPTREVRAPVTGTVIRAGTYTLYCDHVDEFLVIEPDARPGWEVKVLHVEGLTVDKGDRVVGGETVVASNARLLPFASQVDEHTAEPSWPHVHVEVVDPSIPDRPSGRSCS